ncbi:hypothetical protein PPACK8108_LOCUS14901 [Phakopsora pachyrhizi]|uniref:Uncharacterized protein n=1 Tax=Phakopsora pachyrhizi TaxID=170000 RepID=A0AAV0B7R8_PHAPC|nr:hypothetical protein PPACK8108_LOCUS14901 [Phakopsora pachyrhizi]
MRWNLGCTVDAAIRQGRTGSTGDQIRRNNVFDYIPDQIMFRDLVDIFWEEKSSLESPIVEYCSYRFNTLYQHLSSKTQDRNKNKASSTLTVL